MASRGLAARPRYRSAGCHHVATPAPHPGTGECRNQTIKLTDLTVTSYLLQDLVFENYKIIGPAVLAMLEDVETVRCGFETPDAKAAFWPITPDRTSIVGAIGLVRVKFFSCRFEGIGVAAPEAQIPSLMEGLMGG